jgi:hypothetical protein
MGLFRRKRHESHPPITFDGDDMPQAEPAGAAFGYKSAWLAIPAADHAEVADALGLRDAGPTPWVDGVAAVYEADAQKRPAPVFVGAPVDGWVLVPFALPLAEPGEFDLGALSRRFGEAQRFASHRVVESHEWERWVDGQPVRRYGWLGESGEVLFNDGEPTEHEEDLLPDDDADWNEWETADEERVMEIAGAWSLDPTVLDERDDTPDTGLLGRR